MCMVRRGGAVRQPPERDHGSYRFDVMNNRAEAFKKRALQYERAASVATDPDACRMYLDLARQLRVMAEQAKAFERAATLWQGIWWSEASSRE